MLENTGGGGSKKDIGQLWVHKTQDEDKQNRKHTTILNKHK